MHDNRNTNIFWIGATAQQSAQNFKRFIFHEMSQFTELNLCGVPHHPTAVATTGDQYCQEALRHLTEMQFFKLETSCIRNL